MPETNVINVSVEYFYNHSGYKSYRFGDKKASAYIVVKIPGRQKKISLNVYGDILRLTGWKKISNQRSDALGKNTPKKINLIENDGWYTVQEEELVHWTQAAKSKQ